MKHNLLKIISIATTLLMSLNVYAERISLQEAVKSYTIIADFNEQKPLRIKRNQVFWAYPFSEANELKLYNINELNIELHDIPITVGNGLLVQHLNMGRGFFLKKEFHKAAKVWRAASLRYKDNELYNRRLNFFTALAYIELLKTTDERKNNREFLYKIAVAANLLKSSVFDEAEQFDPLLESVLPKYLYYLAVLYYQGGDVGKATTAAAKALGVAYTSANRQFKKSARLLLAHTYKSNRNFLLSAQQLDALIRENSDDASLVVNGLEKIGDIYLGLYNYQLAQNFYELAINIKGLQNTKPDLLVKSGECAFWSDDFKKGRELFGLALARSNMSRARRAWSKLRLADINLATKTDRKAHLDYYQLASTVSFVPVKNLAKIRQLCHEVVNRDADTKSFKYSKNNLLVYSDLKNFGKLHRQTLATSCFLASLARNKTSKEYLQRLAAFYKKKPDSPFFRSLQSLTLAIEKNRLLTLFGDKKYKELIGHYEAHQDTLFAGQSVDYKFALFMSYVALQNYQKASKFYDDEIAQEDTAKLAVLDFHLNTKRAIKPAATVWSVEGKQRVDGDDLIFLSRIINAKRSDYSLIWMLDRFSFDLSSDSECRFIDETLSNNRQISQLDLVRKQVSKLISETYIDGIQTNTCFEDILRTEYLLYEKKPLELAKIYIKRPPVWWRSKVYFETGWQLSESLDDTEADTQVLLLKSMLAKASKTSVTSKYAAQKLFYLNHASH